MYEFFLQSPTRFENGRLRCIKRTPPPKELTMPTLQEMVDQVKRKMDPAKVGMIVCHNGVVRGTSRQGAPAEYLDIDVDQETWNGVLAEMRSRPGIFEIDAHLFTGRRHVGDDVMLVVVAGDIRENVFPVLEMTVNRLKREAVKKHEKLVQSG
jgi:molybdopterin synthase catalytic subunit